MLVPPLVHRKAIDRKLVKFFRDDSRASFRRAISQFCVYYHLRRPRIEWYEYLDWGKTAGKTFEDGRIHLVHPENWKRGRIHHSERMWVQTVYHEMGHYLFWSHPELKADAFTRRMVRGLRRPASARRAASGRRVTTAARIARTGRRRTSADARSSRRSAAARRGRPRGRRRVAGVRARAH